MADLVRDVLSSENGVSDAERGVRRPWLAQGASRGARGNSAALFDTQPPAHEDFELRKGMLLVASLARFGGFPHASRHLAHYLEGGVIGDVGKDTAGNPTRDPARLRVDVAAMLGEIPGLRDSVQVAVQDNVAELSTQVAAGTRPSRVPGKPTGAGAIGAGAGADWFYAMGRFTFRVESNVTYEQLPAGSSSGPPSPPSGVRAHIASIVRVQDVYDWDRDKVVLPFPHPETGESIVIDDAAMRRLHVVGLAREYPIEGSLPLGTQSVDLSARRAPGKTAP